MVIDIAKLPDTEVQVGNEKHFITPRAELLEIVRAVVKAEPKAVGIDIDFSTDEGGYADAQNDPMFFRQLIELSKQVPICVGIRRSHNQAPSKWLGFADFESLAADIWGPEDERKMLKWVEAPDNPTVQGPSLSLALARRSPNNKIEHDSKFAWAITANSEEEIEPGLKGVEFLVDYSPVQVLQDTRLTTKNPAVIADMAWSLKGKTVLIGDAVKDLHPIPSLGHPRSIPGIYKHACGVYTLIQAPLFELTRAGRIAADLILVALVFLLVAGLRVGIARGTPGKFAENTAFAASTIVITIVVLAVGVFFVNYFRTMWDDFLFVIVALWIHRPMDRLLRGLLSALKQVPIFLQKLFEKNQPPVAVPAVEKSVNNKEGP